MKVYWYLMLFIHTYPVFFWIFCWFLCTLPTPLKCTYKRAKQPCWHDSSQKIMTWGIRWSPLFLTKSKLVNWCIKRIQSDLWTDAVDVSVTETMRTLQSGHARNIMKLNLRVNHHIPFHNVHEWNMYISIQEYVEYVILYVFCCFKYTLKLEKSVANFLESCTC